MQHDAVIIGGAFAGLAAATYLVRARRWVADGAAAGTSVHRVLVFG